MVPSKNQSACQGDGTPPPEGAAKYDDGLNALSPPQLDGADDFEIRNYGARLEAFVVPGLERLFRNLLESVPPHLRERTLLYLLESQVLEAPEFVVTSLYLVPKPDKELVVRRLFALGPRGVATVARNLLMFEGVSPNLCLSEFMAYKELDPSVWLKNVSFFPESERERIVLDIVARGQQDIEGVLESLASIPAESHAKVLAAIIESLGGLTRAPTDKTCFLASVLVDYLADFQGVDFQDSLLKLVSFDPAVAEAVAHNLDRFPNVDKQKLADQFLKSSTRMRGTSTALSAVHTLIANHGEPAAAALLNARFRFRNHAPHLPEAPDWYYIPQSEMECRDYDWDVSSRREPEREHIVGFKAWKFEERQYLLRRGRGEVGSKEYRRLPSPLEWLAASENEEIQRLLVWGFDTFDEPEIFRELARAIDCTDTKNRERFFLCVRGAISELVLGGRFARSAAILRAFDLIPLDIVPLVYSRVEELLGGDPQKVDPIRITKAMAFGAWSLLEPEIVDHIPAGRVRALLSELQRVFGEPSPRLLDHFRRYEVFDHFFARGATLLSDSGMLAVENFGALGHILPDIFREAGTKKAWRTHRSNFDLIRAEYPAAGSPLSPAQVEFELRTLLEFHRQFHGVTAPELFREFRSCQRGVGGASSASETEQAQRVEERHQRMVEWQAEFEDSVLQSRECWPLDHMRLQYLDGWTRAGGGVYRRYKALAGADSLRQSALELPREPRTIMVAQGRDLEEGPEFSSQIRVAYERMMETVFDLYKKSPQMNFQEIAGATIRILTERQCAIEGWLSSQAASRVESAVCERNRDELARLREIALEVMKAETSENLLGQLLKVRHKSCDEPISRLVIAHALERLPASAEFVETLEIEPTTRSLTALGQFLRNHVFDESIRELNLSKTARKAVQNALPNLDFELALRDRLKEGPVETDRRPRRESREVMVYPTRGLLAEFAGYFAEACWTDENDLMRRHPNATALVFAFPERHVFRGDDGTTSKLMITNTLVGACYLLQARDLSGTDVIVLRGVNPRDRPFENLSIRSFIEGLIDEVVVPYAKEVGAKRIVVPFDPASHAQTNRLRVGAYFNERYGSMPYVPLDPRGPNTNFNGRRILDKCRLVREIQ